MSKQALQEAIEVLGSQSALAAACNDPVVKQGHVYYWLRASKDGLPPRYCLAVARATAAKGREIPAARLRPDVFGEPEVVAKSVGG